MVAEGEERRSWRDRLRVPSRSRGRSKSSDKSRTREQSAGRERTDSNLQRIAGLDTESLSRLVSRMVIHLRSI